MFHVGVGRNLSCCGGAAALCAFLRTASARAAAAGLGARGLSHGQARGYAEPAVHFRLVKSLAPLLGFGRVVVDLCLDGHIELDEACLRLDAELERRAVP
jgi:hypothetical protein